MTEPAAAMTSPPQATATSSPAGRCPVDHAGQTAPNGCPVSAGAAAFDPFGDGYQQSPPDYLRWARAQEPTFWSPQLGYWVVTRYSSVKAIFRDHRRFSPAIALEKITPTGPEANAVLAQYGYAMNRTLVNEDEPAHMARRRLLIEPFTPEALAHHEPMVRCLVHQYLDRFIADGRADLVDQMLWEVTLTVALHFLGVPEEDMGRLRQYAIAHTVNTWGRPRPDEQVAVAHAVGNFWQLAGEILAKMRRNPEAPGWMQFGIRLQAQHPEVVTDSYLHSMMMAGIVAAHETTANATANAMKLLLQHPRAWAELCADPALIPGAVEECLRHNGSVAAWRRLATEDVVIDGQAIAAGSKLLIVMASANHDEAMFNDPDLFDIRRDNAGEHLTFGYGAHQCMGKHLARLEMQVFLQAFTQRLPHLTLTEQRFSYVANTSFRGPEHLWVQWDPARNPERSNPQLRQAGQPVQLAPPATLVVPRPLVVRQRRQLSPDVVAL
ncbi:MAG: cytochrome, partial [Burkholderiales bacterium PBB5]